MSEFRSKLIRLAAETPKGPDRTALLDMLGPTKVAAFSWGGTAPEHQVEKLRRELEKHTRGAGKVIYIRADDLTRSTGWTAVFDTEYAALKAYYTYRGSRGVRFGRSTNLGGWYMAVD